MKAKKKSAIRSKRRTKLHPGWAGNGKGWRKTPPLKLVRLVLGEMIERGDWCCNERDSMQPVRVEVGCVKITAQHHPHYRIIFT